MLAAIESAQKTISLSTYIFDSDPSGIKFVEALARAVQRQVEVRVLIDAAGTRYSWPPVTRRLHRAKIPLCPVPAGIAVDAMAGGYHQPPQPSQDAYY